MPDGLDWGGQEDFSGGAYPLQERVPGNAVEDCVNGLYASDGSIYRRGGGTVKTGDAAAKILALWDVLLGGGQRTLAVGGSSLYVLGTDDSTWGATPAFTADTAMGLQPALVAGRIAVPVNDGGYGRCIVFGGSRGNLANYSAGTVAVTAGSRIVNGTGTLWLANVDAGTLIDIPDGLTVSNTYVVSQVISNTQLLLHAPWSRPTGSGRSYLALRYAFAALEGVSKATVPVVGSVANRLLMASESLLTFSAPLQPTVFGADDFHFLPDGAGVLGIQALGPNGIIFTTQGIYEITNMSYDLTDASGNAQQQLAPIARDVVLWQQTGLAGVQGGILVPAVDDVYVLTGDGVQPFHAPGMRSQYRAYVKAGYQLGNAVVHRGHYFLPIVDPSVAPGGHYRNYSTTYGFVDVLVMRLDTGAWSRWSGNSAGISFAKRSDGYFASLLVAQAKHVVDASGAFEPTAANKNDADGSTHQLQVTFRTTQRQTAKDQLRKVRVRAEIDDAATDNPTLTAEVAVGRPGSTFTTLAGSMPKNTGQSPYTWTRVNKRGQEFRVRVTSVGPSSKLVIRSVEQAFRVSGRQ